MLIVDRLRFLSNKDDIDQKYTQKAAFEDLCQKISEKGDQKLQQFSETCQELYAEKANPDAEKADPVTQAAVHMLLEATSKKYFLTLEKMRKLEKFKEEEARTEKKSSADLDKLGEFFSMPIS